MCVSSRAQPSQAQKWEEHTSDSPGAPTCPHPNLVPWCRFKVLGTEHAES